MPITRACIACTKMEDLKAKTNEWLQKQNPIYSSRAEYLTNSRMDAWYRFGICTPRGWRDLSLVEEIRPEIWVNRDGDMEPINPRVIYEFQKLSEFWNESAEIGQYVQEFVKAMLSEFGGYWADSNWSVSKGMFPVERGHVWSENEIDVPGMPVAAIPNVASALSGAEVPDEMTWNELFNRLGKAVRITDFDQYAVAYRKYQGGATTHAFG